MSRSSKLLEEFNLEIKKERGLGKSPTSVSVRFNGSKYTYDFDFTRKITSPSGKPLNSALEILAEIDRMKSIFALRGAVISPGFIIKKNPGYIHNMSQVLKWIEAIASDYSPKAASRLPAKITPTLESEIKS